jgi:serine/threonine protein kinase
MPHGNLFPFIKNGFQKQLAKTILLTIADAVNYLHINGVVHGDIKPENILISEEFTLKLCDFGFARLIQNK